MSKYDQLEGTLRASPKSWLVTGAAGFIGSNLVENLLKLDQRVVGFDNFSTGYVKNLQEVQQIVGPKRWANFKLIENDTRDAAACQSACAGIDYVLHQAALGSVPRSITDPIASHESNVTGFINMLVAARDQKAKRLVYASSSAIYGDHPGLPKVEDKIGNLLSPYAATKLINEVYAGTFATAYEFKSIGLRYFNVFGPRQDPDGAYAAVIPKWIAALIKQEPVAINGDGETSRDFCFVDNVVQANLLAATAANPEAVNQAYNIALGERTTLNELFELLQTTLRRLDPKLPHQKPKYQDFRAGDVRHSLADISKARTLLGYDPKCRIADGIDIALDWYLKNVV
ncbi:MAG: NAD-dependent epimerase/dehydratase [Verrucomicrobiales bacterium]|nr:NAD-dependent epimerase/dehydratase [Verrucomicrobiales bacterium]